MQMWIGSSFGAPKRFLADNGGEFGNEQYKDMCGNLNIEVVHTAAESPWQNGLCERNHAVVDRCLEKILEDNPNLTVEKALPWAINAKNCLQMWNGFSSYNKVWPKPKLAKYNDRFTSSNGRLNYQPLPLPIISVLCTQQGKPTSKLSHQRRYEELSDTR